MIELKLFRCLSDAVPQGVQKIPSFPLLTSALACKSSVVLNFWFLSLFKALFLCTFIISFLLISPIFLELITFLHCCDFEREKGIRKKSQKSHCLKFNKSAFFKVKIAVSECFFFLKSNLHIHY